MSKAFTRETDDAPEQPLTRQSATLAPGAKNYLTAKGAERLRHELNNLAVGPVTISTRQRISEIQQSLQSATEVGPPPLPWNQVLFGATVTVRSGRGESTTYHIVGVDETDADRDFISWRSPLAQALFKAHVGDRVRFRTPAGDQELEIIEVHYE